MTDTHLVRRLTTILAIDVVAFSTMSARNEEHALGLLGQRMDTAGTLIREHRGRVFKLTGDGLLAEFASPVEAVRAALEIQEAMRSANATAGPDDQLVLRIGVNLGDVVESGDDLMGDAVNVAVRLESISATGGICVSSSVYDQIIGKLMLGAEDIGEQHVKNIPRPIHAYRLTVDGAKPVAAHPAHTAAKAAPRSRSLLLCAAVVALLVVAAGGTWYLRGATLSGPPQNAHPTSATASAPQAAVPQAAASAPAVPAAAPTPAAPPPAAGPRPFIPAEVPFLPDFRRRALENYAADEGSKALAISIRGIIAMATRRVDVETARRVALEECDKIVLREVPVFRDYDRCMIYAVGNDVVWSFRPPPTPPFPYVPSKRPSPPIAFDPTTAPLLNVPARERLAEHYLKAVHSRALVLGRNHFDWWTSSNNDDDAIRRNVQICGHLTGRPCVVYALNNDALVQTPTMMRPVNILTPTDIGNLDPNQHEAVMRYLIANDWRAIAASSAGRLGIASDRASEQDAVAAARQACAQAGGTDCTVVAIGPFLVEPK
jgi:class 3 adenylate cyclase